MSAILQPLRLLHFNDVYNIEENHVSPFAGAARFSARLQAVSKASDGEPLIVFSGDLFNPSMMSTVHRGKQMVDVINCLGVQVACHGNHDYVSCALQGGVG